MIDDRVPVFSLLVGVNWENSEETYVWFDSYQLFSYKPVEDSCNGWCNKEWGSFLCILCKWYSLEENPNL